MFMLKRGKEICVALTTTSLWRKYLWQLQAAHLKTSMVPSSPLGRNSQQS
jgi:hypothetical protein